MSSEWADEPAQDAGSKAAQSANHGIPGKTLAAQREALGWTVEQVADQLKMAVRQVVALEAGDYASLPSAAVVRGFVRAYAKVVKLDAAPLVAQIALDTPAVADTSASRTVRRDKPTSFSEVRFPTNGKKRGGLPYGLIGGVLVLVAGIAAAWQFGLIPHTLLPGAAAPAASSAPAAAAGGQASSVTVLPPPLAAEKAPAGHIETTLVKPGEEMKPLQNPQVPLISVPPPTPAANAPATLAASPGAAGTGTGTGTATTPATATPAAAAPAPGSNALVLRVREDSWVAVQRAKGAPLLARMVKGGSVETLDVAEPVTLIVGKPSAVDATFRGNPVNLPVRSGTSIARVPLQ